VGVLKRKSDIFGFFFQNRSQNPHFGLKKLLKTKSILEILGQVYQKSFTSR